MSLLNFEEIRPTTYPPGRYVLRVKNFEKEHQHTTLGFYGTDYITFKRADRMKYKNFLAEFMKARFGDFYGYDQVEFRIRSVLKYHCYLFKNNTDITKIIDIQLEKQDSGLKLSKIFGEYSDTVKLTAKPGESVVLYAKDWMLKATYQVTDDEESQTKDQQQQNLQSKETQQNDVEKFKPQQEKIQQVIAQEESLHDEEEERDAKQEDDKSVYSEVEDTERENNKRGDLEIENF